jgi:toxin secretion/phage lysis holin
MDTLLENLGNFFGAFDSFLFALIVFMVVDFITGLCKGYITKELSSKVGKEGIVKKAVIFMVIVVAHVIDTYVIQTGAVLRTVVVLFYIAEEGLSIIENIGACGVPIPKKLIDAIKTLKQKEEGEGNEK